MDIVVTVLLTILIFGLLIFIHELGHFTFAKLFKVRVHEFALGMGPTLLKFTKGETKYAIRAFPIGGFVAMEGENDESADENAFCNKKLWQRIIIVSAGAVMNIILGFILMFVIVLNQQLLTTNIVAEFDSSAVSNKGEVPLMVGDEIVKVNGNKLNIFSDLTYEFIRDTDGYIDLTVIRDGKETLLEGVNFQIDTIEEVSILRLDFKVYGQEKTAGLVIKETYYQVVNIVKMVWSTLIDLVTGRYGLNQLQGPVGVASAVGEVSKMGILPILNLVVLISVNLGVFNLLPIPAMDGGRLFFMLIELVRGKPINQKYEGLIHFIGIILLLGLMVVVMFNDIVKLFN